MENEFESILKRLPHRYPFLLVDRVIEVIKGKKIVALKNVTINEPFFQGHFPGKPIMPGVLVVEAMGQAGGLLFSRSLPPENQDQMFYFMGFDKVRFRKPVVPGDQLILEIEILRMRSKAIKMAGVAKVDEDIVAEGQFMATYGE